MANRILLVDDQREVIRLLHSALNTLEQKFEIIEAPSGEEALLEVTRGKIDLVVIDYLLPGMSGLELMQKIITHDQDTQIILISGVKDKKVREELKDSDAFAFFEKPISLTDFLDAVERSMDLKRTVLPPEEENGDSDAHKNLSGLLSKYRISLGAQVIFLLSDKEDVLAKAGALKNGSLEDSLLSALMGIYRGGQKVSGFIHQKDPLSYHIFPGGDQDMLLVPVNNSHALIVAGKGIVERSKVLELTDAMMILKSEVEHVLDAMGVTRSPEEKMDDYLEPEDTPEEEIIEDEDESSVELDTLLTEKTEVKTTEADSFWEEAVVNKTNQPVDADKLSYDQARQLGLTPDDTP